MDTNSFMLQLTTSLNDLKTPTTKFVLKKVVDDFVKNHIICRLRIPESIVTYNGTNLNSDLMKALCEKFKINHRNSTTYKPHRNEAVANKNIKRILLVIPAEVEIPSLRILQEAELSDAKKNRIARAFNKKVRPRYFSPRKLVLKQIFPNQDEANEDAGQLFSYVTQIDNIHSSTSSISNIMNLSPTIIQEVAVEDAIDSTTMRVREEIASALVDGESSIAHNSEALRFSVHYLRFCGDHLFAMDFDKNVYLLIIGAQGADAQFFAIMCSSCYSSGDDSKIACEGPFHNWLLDMLVSDVLAIGSGNSKVHQVFDTISNEAWKVSNVIFTLLLVGVLVEMPKETQTFHSCT
ncbi:hypothetical protein MTR67_013461 [Solanum verrucosum]|uniref:Uncharacterized protein n=1 Tax=Solanum verrucosum TaxID=315347 RepID=A0AAF0THY9_SOLVR|nr:hypothetical protein MTR67_013461 [Solanum verrucosum]